MRNGARIRTYVRAVVAPRCYGNNGAARLRDSLTPMCAIGARRETHAREPACDKQTDSRLAAGQSLYIDGYTQCYF